MTRTTIIVLASTWVSLSALGSIAWATYTGKRTR